MQLYKILQVRGILKPCRISILLLILLVVSIASSSFAQTTVNEPEDELESLIRELVRIRYPLLVKENLVDKVIENAKVHLGRPYKFRNPHGDIMDCSGFMVYVFSQEGIRLPRTSSQQFGATTQIPLSEVQKGDLLFFTGTNTSSRKIGHVSMVCDTSDGQIKMIHSSSRGIVIDNYPSGYYGKRFLYAGRVKQLDELISVSGK